MSVGVPVVSTRCGGPEYYIRENSGFLVEKRDTTGLAEALIRVISDRDLRERLGKGAQSIVKQEFAPDIVFSRFLNAYQGKSSNE